MGDEVQQVSGGLSAVNETPTTGGGLTVKNISGPGGGKYQANVELPQDFYDNMKAELDRRSGGFNTFLESMKDAVAITSNNPMAMIAREKQKDEQRAAQLEMRMKLATWEQAQKQNAAEIGGYWGTQKPTTTQAAPGAEVSNVAGQPVIQGGELSPFEQTIAGLPEHLKAAARSLPKTVANRDAIIKMAQDIEGKKSEPEKLIDRLKVTDPSSYEWFMLAKKLDPDIDKPGITVEGGVKRDISPAEKIQALRNYIKQDLAPKPVAPGIPAAAPTTPAVSTQAVAAPAVTTKPAPVVSAQPAPVQNKPAAPAPVVSGSAASPATVGGISSASQPGVEMRKEDYGRSQESVQKNVIDPLFAQSKTLDRTVAQVDRALIALENANTGPGTVIKQTGTELKGIFKGLEGKELDKFVNTKILDQTQKTLIGSNLKAVYGGNPSNTEGEKFERTLYSINDPKQFIRAALELAKVNAIYDKETLAHLTKNKSNTADAYNAWTSSGRYNELIKQYAPTISKQMGVEPTAAAKESVPPLNFEDLQTQRNRNRNR